MKPLDFVKLIDKENDLKMSTVEVKNYTKSLIDAGYNEIKGHDIATVKKLITSKHRKKKSTLRVIASNTVNAELASCPLCKKSMGTVIISGNRKAYYCNEHRITLPIIDK